MLIHLGLNSPEFSLNLLIPSLFTCFSHLLKFLNAVKSLVEWYTIKGILWDFGIFLALKGILSIHSCDVNTRFLLLELLRLNGVGFVDLFLTSIDDISECVIEISLWLLTDFKVLLPSVWSFVLNLIHWYILLTVCLPLWWGIHLEYRFYF